MAIGLKRFSAKETRQGRKEGQGGKNVCGEKWRLRNEMRRLRDDGRGFSYLETVFSLAVVLLFLHFLIPVVAEMRHAFETAQVDLRLRLEAEALFSFVEEEVKGAVSFVTAGSKMLFATFEGKKIMYEKYGHLLRRQVHGEGHTVLAYDVRDVDFARVGSGITITVTLERDGRVYSTSSHFRSSLLQD
ncbi:hypothetical protein BSNK01_06170 [Bacillaceae bacterium]